MTLTTQILIFVKFIPLFSLQPILYIPTGIEIAYRVVNTDLFSHDIGVLVTPHLLFHFEQHERRK